MKPAVAPFIPLLATLAALPSAEKAKLIVVPEICIHHTPRLTFIGPRMISLENGDILMAAPDSGHPRAVWHV